MSVQPDYSRIKTKLQMTGLQQKDNRLYQVIHDLITAVEQQQAFGNQQINAISGGGGVTNITQQILGFLEDNSTEESLLASGGSSSTASTTGFFNNEVPTGSINGTNKTFTTAHNYVAGTLEVFLNGVRQQITLDYTETGVNTFDFVDAPLSGDTVLVDYGTLPSAIVGAAGPTGATGPQGQIGFAIDGDIGEDSLIPGPTGATGPAGAAGKIVQIVKNESGAVQTGTTTIPFDDTIPQKTEGTEFFTQAITPTSATNILRIDITIFATVTTTPWIIVALFQDAGNDALATAATFISVNTAGATITFSHFMVAGTTSATTFKVRVGPSNAATVTLNGQSSARIFGGVAVSGISITEYQP